jgi:hypothetical protein
MYNTRGRLAKYSSSWWGSDLPRAQLHCSLVSSPAVACAVFQSPKRPIFLPMMKLKDSLKITELHTPSHEDKSLCSSCKKQFIQPKKEPSADTIHDPLDSPYRRLGKDILNASHAGCQLCTLVWSKLTNLFCREVGSIENAIISPNLCWDEDTNEYCRLVYWAVVGNTRSVHVDPELQLPSKTGSVYPELFSIDINPGSGKSMSIPSRCMF